MSVILDQQRDADVRPEEAYTVQQAAELTGLSEHTLRYYERVGLLQPVRRDRSSQHRRYTADDIAQLDAMACLRAIGMPLDQMRQYLAQRGAGVRAAQQQRRLLEQHQQVLEARLRAARRHLAYVRYKIDYWQAVELGDDAVAADAKQRARAVLHSGPDLEHGEE